MTGSLQRRVRRLRSNEGLDLCPHCGSVVQRSETEAYRLVIKNPTTGCMIEVVWHSACAEADEGLQGFADSDMAKVRGDADADRQTALAWHAMLDGIIEKHGVPTLRGAIRVRRDINSPVYTMRGPGSLWGRSSEK